MADPVRVTIYDTAVDGLFRPGGQAWNWLGLLGTEHLNLAIAFAPARSGHLKSSHYPAPIMTSYTSGGQRGSRYTIRNDADYALYVHEGTNGPITASGENGLWVPVFRGIPYPRHSRPSVRGQAANPWITRAGEVALAPFM